MSKGFERDVYLSPEWRDLRFRHLAAHGSCVVCGGRSHLEVDHIVPIKDDFSQAFEMENLQTLCHAHHVEKTKADRKGYYETRDRRGDFVDPNHPVNQGRNTKSFRISVSKTLQRS